MGHSDKAMLCGAVDVGRVSRFCALISHRRFPGASGLWSKWTAHVQGIALASLVAFAHCCRVCPSNAAPIQTKENGAAYWRASSFHLTAVTQPELPRVGVGPGGNFPPTLGLILSGRWQQSCSWNGHGFYVVSRFLHLSDLWIQGWEREVSLRAVRGGWEAHSLCPGGMRPARGCGSTPR